MKQKSMPSPYSSASVPLLPFVSSVDEKDEVRSQEGRFSNTTNHHQPSQS